MSSDKLDLKCPHVIADPGFCFHACQLAAVSAPAIPELTLIEPTNLYSNSSAGEPNVQLLEGSPDSPSSSLPFGSSVIKLAGMLIFTNDCVSPARL